LIEGVFLFLYYSCTSYQSAFVICALKNYLLTYLIYENARLGCKVNFARGKIMSGARAPKIYI